MPEEPPGTDTEGEPPDAGGGADGGDRLVVLLPAKDEEEAIGDTIDGLPTDELDGLGLDVEVVVVDGQSDDRTPEIARERGARVIVQEGQGKGRGFRSALPALEGDYVVMIDADHTYPSEMIPDFVEELRDGADVVMGSRFRGEIAAGSMSRLNRLGNRLLTALARLLYRRPVTDVCTGMWGFRRDALEDLPLSAGGFDLEADLFSTAVGQGLDVREIPILYRPRRGDSELRSLRDGLRIAGRLLRNRFRR